MAKKSAWTRFLPSLGVALAVVLAAAAAVLTVGGGTPNDEGELGRLMAATQAARAQARAALAGDTQDLAELARGATEIERLRRSLAAGHPLAADDRWGALTTSLAAIQEAGPQLQDLRAARERLASLVPQLLAATGNLVSLSPADLEANQIHLERFELAAASLRQSLHSLAAAEAIGESVQRVSDAEQYLGQFIRGLAGDDSSLGVVPVGSESAAELEAVVGLLDETRAGIGNLVAGQDAMLAADGARAAVDGAAAALLERYRATPAAGSAAADPLPLALVAAALVLSLLMLFAYYKARDFRRAADFQAEQNQRNQEAILRLLDELASLADGDLTVQATVTEDITGAIADSINYAIDALRELVATIDRSSILVDGSTKQTEATAAQLVRANETQVKQVAAASESIAQLAGSIEEVSGNAERCSDVARHAVEVAHKGGDAVRRTIAGMNTIRETIQDTSKRIKRLGESSQEIGNIVELIEEIAEQTNILALNASIEASRAGEASRGFAVVADEVQKLAERSTNATRKIEVLVSTIQSDTNEAVVSMERSTTDVVGGALLAENAGAALEEIEQVSHQIASLVQNISTSAHEQAGSASALTKNMEVLRDVSARTTHATTATSSAISKLSELASQLRSTVSGFRLPEQGTSMDVLSHSRAAPARKPEPEAVAADEAAPVTERRLISG